jgi:hypothetical protein
MRKFADHKQKITVAVFVNTEFAVAILMTKNTRVGQNNGKTTDTIHISSLLWRWTIFCLQYGNNPFRNGLVKVLNSL